MLISPFGSEPVSASEMAFLCTWVCVLRSCTSAGESGHDGELPCAFSCTFDLGRGPRLAPGTFFGPDQLSGSLLLLFLQEDFKVLFLLPFFFPFGPYSSPIAARADRIGMAVGG